MLYEIDDDQDEDHDDDDDGKIDLNKGDLKEKNVHHKNRLFNSPSVAGVQIK